MTSITTSTREYRIQGPGLSGLEAIKNNPNAVVHIPTESEKQAFKALEEQERLAEEASQKQLRENPDKIFGQVIVNGKVFATVYDSGVTEMTHGMSLPNNASTPLELAKARLNAIAKSVKGEIRHSDFLPTLGGTSARSPGPNPSLEAAQRRVDEILKSIQWRYESSHS